MKCSNEITNDWRWPVVLPEVTDSVIRDFFKTILGENLERVCGCHFATLARFHRPLLVNATGGHALVNLLPLVRFFLSSIMITKSKRKLELAVKFASLKT